MSAEQLLTSKVLTEKRCVIVLEDNEADAERISLYIENSDLDIHIILVENSQQLKKSLLENNVLAVFIDYYVGPEIGTDIIQQFKIEYPVLPFILLTGRGDEFVVSEALRVGVKDYLKKDDLNANVFYKVLVDIISYWDQENKIHKQSELLLQQAAIINSASDAVIHANLAGDILFMNHAAQILFGHSFSQIKNINTFVARLSKRSGHFFTTTVMPKLNCEAHWKGDLNLVADDGAHLPISMNVFPLIEEHSKKTGFAAIMRDISDEKAKENMLIHAAHHDQLTGLPNRTLITKIIGSAIETAVQTNTILAVLFLDLDHFKSVNDTLGHDEGDKLLQRVARRLSSTIRASDHVGRLGGDEFIIILENIDEMQSVNQLAARILALMKVPIVIQGHRVYITPSMGIATYPESGKTARELLQKADMAMYHTKSSGRNGFQFYADSLQHAALLYAKTKHQIILGLQNNSFFLMYQEIVDRDNNVAGWEALVRWRNELGTVMSPDQFIPVAEQTGLIVDLGQWIIKTALEQFADLVASRECVDNPTISINLSALQLQDLDLIGCLQRQLKKVQLPVNRVVLELTESALIEKDNHSFRVIEALSEAGFTIAMDDFGTGYASFRHLQQLPISVVKIDRSFITNVHAQPSKAAMVDALLSMADALGLDIVVEGIETFEERHFFQNRNCNKFQGFYFHRPSAIISLDNNMP